jgi:hypothetical protein
MKKLVVPLILTFLIAGLLFYLKSDPKASSGNLDAALYLETRSKIDSLQVELWNQNKNPEKRAQILSQLDLAWDENQRLKSPIPVSSSESEEKTASIDLQIGMWFTITLVVIICILGMVVLLLKKKRDAITRQMEQIRAEQRFKAPKGGFQEDPTFVNRTRVRRSIIDDAKAFAEEEKQKMSEVSPNDIAFEDENGLPENKIMAYGPDDKPALRPTAKERITTAMQSLSDALVRPKGMTREKTMRVRAQSRNTLNGSSENNPLDITRFDQERSDKERVLQLMRRGYTNSEIARRMQISQEQVDTIIREIRDAGA